MEKGSAAGDIAGAEQRAQLGGREVIQRPEKRHRSQSIYFHCQDVLGIISQVILICLLSRVYENARPSKKIEPLWEMLLGQLAADAIFCGIFGALTGLFAGKIFRPKNLSLGAFA